MLLMKESGSGDGPRFRAILVNEIGYMLNQGLHREPSSGLEAGVQRGVLLLESSFPATFGSHPESFRVGSAAELPRRAMYADVCLVED